MSSNNEIDSDVPAMIGASAALAISGIPFDGPIRRGSGGLREWPVCAQSHGHRAQTSQLNLVVAGTQQAVLMVESEAHELPEDVMLGAVMFGHEQMQAVINVINELADEAGKPMWDWTPAAKDQTLIDLMAQMAEADLRQAYQLRGKQERQQKLAEILNRVTQEFVPEGSSSERANIVGGEFSNLEAKIVRNQILDGEPRIDGRDTRTVRPISIRTGVLPRAHGTALFTRGETQAIVTATLGTSRDEQIIDALQGEYRERFMMHYNFPPMPRVKQGRVGSPKRREIGHGRLAKRALLAVLPTAEEFAYSLRVVSEITGVERLELDGVGVRRLSGADGCRRAAESARRGNRDGPHQGRQPLRRPVGHPRRRRSSRRHGFQGGRHRARRHGAADGHQDPGHHEGDHARRARPGSRRPHAHPRENEAGDRQPAHRAVGLRRA